PTPPTAGVVQTFTVTAYDAFGNTATGYRGTLHFTSSDPRAVLPLNSPFPAFDKGRHTFQAIRVTAGGQSLTATDAADPSITGSRANIKVVAAAAASLRVTAPATFQVGVAFSI